MSNYHLTIDNLMDVFQTGLVQLLQILGVELLLGEPCDMCDIVNNLILGSEPLIKQYLFFAVHDEKLANFTANCCLYHLAVNGYEL